jgi:hypothetical protein
VGEPVVAGADFTNPFRPYIIIGQSRICSNLSL